MVLTLKLTLIFGIEKQQIASKNITDSDQTVLYAKIYAKIVASLQE